MLLLKWSTSFAFLSLNMPVVNDKITQVSQKHPNRIQRLLIRHYLMWILPLTSQGINQLLIKNILNSWRQVLCDRLSSLYRLIHFSETLKQLCLAPHRQKIVKIPSSPRPVKNKSLGPISPISTVLYVLDLLKLIFLNLREKLFFEMEIQCIGSWLGHSDLEFILDHS